MLVLLIGFALPAWAAPAAGKLPDAHTITITVSRDKPGKQANDKKIGEVALPGGAQDITIGGKKPKKGHGIGGGKLPGYHTITITVTRDKKKPASGKKPEEMSAPSKREASLSPSTARKEEPAAKPIEISGGWDWFPLGTAPSIGMSIIQSGRHVVATVNRDGRENKKIEIVYTGTFNPPKLELIHRLQDISLLARLSASDYEEELYNIETYSGISRLLASGIVSRLQLHVVKENTNFEFHLEGTYIPFDSRLDGIGEVQTGKYKAAQSSLKEEKAEVRMNPPEFVGG